MTRARIVSDGGTLCEGHVHVDVDGQHREYKRGKHRSILEIQSNGVCFPVLELDGRTAGIIRDGETLLEAVRRLRRKKVL